MSVLTGADGWRMNMLRITIIQVGKTKDANLDALVAAFEIRLRSSVKLSWVSTKTEADLWQSVPDQAYVALLDVQGQSMTSEAFAQWIEQRKNQGDSHLVFLIGPAQGFRQIDRARVRQTLSLSAMTFSHQSIRLLLIEQIYRAICILEGKPFPK
jgi:23S rRNA (pseudouridine1915-N3)-methyltransferase